MVKVSPEVKKLADKYCDEQGGPPKKEEEGLIVGVDYAGTERRILSWMDDYDDYNEITFHSWEDIMAHQARSFMASRACSSPEPKYRETIPVSKLPPEKPWIKFNPTPKNPKRGPR